MLVARGRAAAVVLALGASMVVVAPAGPQAGAAPAVPAAPVVQDLRVEMSDGVEVAAKLGGAGPLVDGHLPPRPTIVEFSPYNQACCPPGAGDAYNYLSVHIRGTGESDGSFDALGPRTQADVAEVLGWACSQPWSDGHLGLYGFSASAITVYNSLHLELPCVDTAVLGAGTHELYRDLMYPGGIPNIVPALGVLLLIGAPMQATIPDRLGRDPLSILDSLVGLFDTGFDYLAHPSLDGWWQERGMRGNANDWPILMITGIFDVESRGPFQAFQELRGNGSHLMVVGAHDGVPAGSGGSDATRVRWYDRYLRGLDTGVEDDPAVQLWLSNGDREAMLAGDFSTVAGDDWPLPGTEWRSLWLDAVRSGTGTSLNDGTLASAPSPQAVQQAYLPIPSLPSATDPHTTSLLGFFNGTGPLTDMTLAEPLGLSYTTEPFAQDVVAVGPASLEVQLTSLTPETDIYAVVSDVAPDGTAHPVATGRLRTAYPKIVAERSLVDTAGDVVQPYGDFSTKAAPPLGTEQRYHVELWPIGNRFRTGHRLRLHIVGASAFHLPGLPVANLVRVGGADASRLLLPVVPDPAAPATPAASAEPDDGALGSGGADPAELTAAGTRSSTTGRLPSTGGQGASPMWLAAALAVVGWAAHRVGSRARGRSGPLPPA